MLDIIPNAEQMTALVGKPLYEVWEKLCALIDERYAMEAAWNRGGKAWTYLNLKRRQKNRLKKPQHRAALLPAFAKGIRRLRDAKPDFCMTFRSAGHNTLGGD